MLTTVHGTTNEECELVALPTSTVEPGPSTDEVHIPAASDTTTPSASVVPPPPPPLPPLSKGAVTPTTPTDSHEQQSLQPNSFSISESEKKDHSLPHIETNIDVTASMLNRETLQKVESQFQSPGTSVSTGDGTALVVAVQSSESQARHQGVATSYKHVTFADEDQEDVKYDRLPEELPNMDVNNDTSAIESAPNLSVNERVKEGHEQLTTEINDIDEIIANISKNIEEFDFM